MTHHYVYQWDQFHGWRQMLVTEGNWRTSDVVTALESWGPQRKTVVALDDHHYAFGGTYVVGLRGRSYIWGYSPEWQNAIDVAVALQVRWGGRYTIAVKTPLGAEFAAVDLRSSTA